MQYWNDVVMVGTSRCDVRALVGRALSCAPLGTANRLGPPFGGRAQAPRPWRRRESRSAAFRPHKRPTCPQYVLARHYPNTQPAIRPVRLLVSGYAILPNEG